MKKVWLQVLFIYTAAICFFGIAGCSLLQQQTTESSAARADIPTPTATAVSTCDPTTASVTTPTTSPTLMPAVSLPPGTKVEARFFEDLDRDGENESIIASSAEDEIDFDRISVGVITKTSYDEILVCNGIFDGAYRVQTESGEICVLISCQDPVISGGDTYACSFSGLTPVLGGWADGLITGMDGTHITVEDWADFIGSWYYTRECELTDDFSLVPMSDMMPITEDREPLHTIRELPVEMLVDGEYAAGTLPTGTYLFPTTGDGKSTMCFKLEDGSEGRIRYIRDESFCAMIDGVSEYEYFDNVDYWS